MKSNTLGAYGANKVLPKVSDVVLNCVWKAGEVLWFYNKYLPRVFKYIYLELFYV